MFYEINPIIYYRLLTTLKKDSIAEFITTNRCFFIKITDIVMTDSHSLFLDTVYLLRHLFPTQQFISPSVCEAEFEDFVYQGVLCELGGCAYA